MAFPVAALAPLFVKFGAPILADLVLSRSPKIVRDVLGSVATKLGIDANPETIAETLEAADPRSEAAVYEAEQQDISYWTRIAEIEAAMHAETQATMRAEHGARSVLTRNWRPINGLALAAECFMLIATVCVKLLSGDLPDLDAYAPLLAIIGPTLTAQAGVVGVYTWRRSTEKIAGKT